jgi:hypothetical protein
MDTIDVLARQRQELAAQREVIDQRIKSIDAAIIDAVEIGGSVTIDGQPAYRVQQRRSFSAHLTRRPLNPLNCGHGITSS